VQRAARRRCATIVVANADRGLPFQDQSMDLVASIDARRPVAEMARIVKPTGRVIVVAPAADDMAELRALVLGRAEDLPGGAGLEVEFAPAFACCARERVEERVRLDHEGLRALAAATYRLARRKERDQLDALATQEVVARHDVRVFELRS
jgi:23S rRNA (guanine745-N1)-methyltransferase